MTANSSTDTARSTDLSATVRGVLTPVIALLVLGAFAAFIIFLLDNLNLTDSAWSRAIYLFGGVEAVAFAAGGYVFGTQIQRGNVEQAKQEAKTATQIADAAKQSAGSERRASRILAQGIVNSASSGSGGLMGGDPAGPPIDPALVEQARRLLED